MIEAVEIVLKAVKANAYKNAVYYALKTNHKDDTNWWAFWYGVQCACHDYPYGTKFAPPENDEPIYTIATQSYQRTVKVLADYQANPKFTKIEE